MASGTLAPLVALFVDGELLELRRNHELWRIVTCHFTHWSYEQLAWDAVAFILLAVACARRDRHAFHATLLASIILVPLAVLAFAPDIAAYRGLSGLASAMFALLLTLQTTAILRDRTAQWRTGNPACPDSIQTGNPACPDSIRTGRIACPPRARGIGMTALLAAGFAAKLIFETSTGGTVFIGSMGENVVSVPVAHLAGAVIGVIGGLPRKRLALLAPLLLTACVSIPLPFPELSSGACSTAKELLGRWRSKRLTQLGPANVDLVLRDDCRFVMRIGLLFANVTEEGTYAVANDELRLKRRSGETVWPIRRDANGRLLVQEARGQWHTYTHDPCASFWPCSSR